MNNCGWGYTPHPTRKLIQSLLLHGMCLFEDEIKTAVREALLKQRCGESDK